MKVIILAGGSGTRFWPLSRERYPKQFIKLKQDKMSLFQEAFKRSLLIADLNDIFVVTNKKYKFLLKASIEELGYDYEESNIILEPEAKNTLPAIYAGVNEIMNKSEKIETVVVFPSDHIIQKEAEFVKAIKSSVELIKDNIVTFGIKPDKPNTAYGYIAPGEEKLNGYEVMHFKEKPDYETSVTYVNKGYFWNSGMFMFNTEFFINEVKLYAEDIFYAFKTSENIEEAFKKINNSVSIDYGIMEKSRNIAVVPVEIGWNDLGSFDALYDVFSKDENDNIINPNSIVMDSKNNYVYSEPNKLVTMIGVNDLIAVDNKDVLLICKKDQSQKVKDVIEILKSKNNPITEYHTRDYRPWGNYEVLEEECNNFKIKRILVNQGKKISYQLHHHRSEHWIVVKGMAQVTIDETEKFLSAGESIFIKPGQKHRLENPGKIPLEIIEVQMGDYLEEDDIVRFSQNNSNIL